MSLGLSHCSEAGYCHRIEQLCCACAGVQMKADEQMVRIAELESCVEKAAMDTDRRLTQQQHEYEHRIQLLMKQLTHAEVAGHSDLMAQIKTKEAR